MPQPRILLLQQRRLSYWSRTLRAVYRDTYALLREFRTPILLFLLSTIGGGYVYGELLARAGYPRLPYFNLPYTMFQIMFMQGGTPPAEPQLTIFWYVMPIISAYIIGRGTFDFFRLFFDRSERRKSWEAALASTYRNHVIILGIGHLGLRVTRSLVEMGFEVVAIDSAIEDDAREELGRLNVPLIETDAHLISTLESAGLRHAQAFIVCTSDEHTNLMVAMRIREMNPDIRIVLRMWDKQFSKEILHQLRVQAILSASDLAAPIFAGSALNIEIAQTIRVANVDYSMIRVNVESGSFMDGVTIGNLQHKYEMDIVLHCAQEHGGVEVHPANTNVVHPGDTLVIFAQHSKIVDVVTRNRRRA